MNDQRRKAWWPTVTRVVAASFSIASCAVSPAPESQEDGHVDAGAHDRDEEQTKVHASDAGAPATESGTGFGTGREHDCDHDPSPVFVNPSEACLADYLTAKFEPIDLYFMVSTAGSMDCPAGAEGENCTRAPSFPVTGPTRWSEMRNTLQDFWSSDDNGYLSAGLGFSPRICSCAGSWACSCSDSSPSVSCSTSDYVGPNAEISSLNGYDYGGYLSYTINNQMRAGATSTTAPLAGALQHATAWAMSHAGHRVAVVYATDAMSTDCGDEGGGSSDPAQIAESYATGNPAIPTYVLGVGPNIDDLNRIARGGHTEKAYVVDTGRDVAAQLAGVFSSIHNHMLSCDYTIPKADEPLDYSDVSIVAAIGATGSPQRVARVKDEADCDPRTGGWYYDDPEKPKVISLCHATRQPLLATAGSHVEVLIGCAKGTGSQ